MRKPGCPSPDELTRVAGRPIDPEADMHAIDSHLRECASCRSEFRAALADKDTTVQSPVTLFLDDDRSPCLTDDECARYVRAQMDAFERESADLHLVDCSLCKAVIDDLEQFEGDMALDSPSRLRAAAVEVGRFGAWIKSAGKSLIRELSDEVYRAREALRPASVKLAFSSGPGDAERTKLDFGPNSEFSGSYRMSEECRLHIEHATAPSGTLVLLEAVDPAEEVVWRQFVVLRKGMRRAVADLVVSDDLELRHLQLGIVAADSLTNDAAEEIARSFRAVEENDLARAAWISWADSARAITQPSAIASVLRAITGEAG
jgi:hypothetical protein